MRIGMFTMSYVPTPDGVAYYVHEAKRELEKEHEVFVLTSGPDMGGRVLVEDHVYKLPSVHFPPYPVYRAPIFPFLRGLGVAKKLDLDIIHAHTPFLFATMAYVHKHRANIPLVSTFHTDFMNMKGTLNGYLLNNVLIDVGWGYSCSIYRRSDAVIAPTEIMAEKLRKETDMWAPVHVVWDGINPENFASAPSLDVVEKFNIDPDSPVVLFLSRITVDKGVFTLLRTAKEIHKKTGAVFVIAGKGPSLEELRKKVREEQAEEYFRVVGYVTEEEKIALYHAADVFVLPSKAETFGMVMLEAMASKTPVIGAASGGILEVIRDGENGMLFPWDDHEELSQRILMLLEDKNTHGRLVQEGYRFVNEEASIAKSARKTLEIYEGLLRR